VLRVGVCTLECLYGLLEEEEWGATGMLQLQRDIQRGPSCHAMGWEEGLPSPVALGSSYVTILSLSTAVQASPYLCLSIAVEAWGGAWARAQQQPPRPSCVTPFWSRPLRCLPACVWGRDEECE
jgi:hypothetical protein